MLDRTIDPAVSEAEIDDPLARCHAASGSAGVEDYPFEDLKAHYADTLLLLLVRMASVDLLDLGGQDGRDADLVTVWIQRLDARMARVSPGR